MDLLEYQAKELFHQVGIPILPSQTIGDPSELKRLQIPYPVVLKSQVRAGGRGRAGGIRFVENTIDAIAAARTIFNLPIMGEYPEVILAEARYNTEEEFFLAVLLDYQLQRRVLLGSTKGGIDLDTLLAHMQKVVVEEEFSPFYARRLAIKMGLQGPLIQSVSSTIEKMYYLFSEKDLDLVEINPLGVSVDGELMALDGKISFNNAAIKRHPDIVSLTAPKKTVVEQCESELDPSAAVEIPIPRWLDRIDEKGNIGIICNSLGLAMSIWDLIVQDKGKPACCLTIGEDTSGKWLPDGTLFQQLKQAIEMALEVKGLKVILIDLLVSPDTVETIAQALSHALPAQVGQRLEQTSEERVSRATRAESSQRSRNIQSRAHKSQPSEPPQFAIHLGGVKSEVVKEGLTSISVNWTDDLDSAIAQILSLAKSR